MRTRQLLTPLTGAALLGAAIAIAAWPEDGPAAPRQPAIRQVRVAEVGLADGRRSVRFAGVARAAERARLAFTLPGRLASRGVETGYRVRAGQVVASLDAREYRLAESAASSALTELEVRLAQAERDEARAERLAAAKAATAEEVEQVRTAAAAFRAAAATAAVRVSDARRLVEESVLTAPFAGTVTAVSLQAGEWASPGVTVVEIAGDGALEVELELPERVAASLPLGRELQVELPAAAAVTTGRVASLARAANGPGSLFPVVVDLHAHRALVPGTAVEVLLELDQDAALDLPLEAVLNPGSSLPSVFRVRDGRVRQVFVELGRLEGGRVVVNAKLEVGDQVVVAGHTALADGDLVEVR